MAARSDVAPAQDTDFVIARVFDAPRELVWKVWTDPAHLAQWWGPRFFTATCTLDVRPGGAFRITMKGPDGSEHPLSGKYVEVKAPERLVYTADHSELPEAFLDQIDPTRERNKGRPLAVALTTVTLGDQGGKTLLTVSTRFESKAVRDAFARLGMREGWSLSLEKLDELLFHEREIVATRVFQAPRDLVFQAWTSPAHLGQWWGPRGFSLTVREHRFEKGGRWRFVMHGPDGRDYENEHEYVEIARPERLVLDHLSPPRFRMTASFSEWQGTTTVTVRMRFETAKVRDATAREHGAVEGLGQTLDRLGELVAKLPR